MGTLRVVDQAKRAKGFGVDALVATAPFYALGGPEETERRFRAIREHTDLPLFAYDLPVCVHTKLDPTMLVRLGKDGVLQGVDDSSGDDVSFRWLVLENEDAWSSAAELLTGHEACVDGAYLAGADGSVPGLANLDPHSYVEQRQGRSGRRLEPRQGDPGPPCPPDVPDPCGQGHRRLRRRRGRVQDGFVADGRVRPRTRCASPSRRSRARMSRPSSRSSRRPASWTRTLPSASSFSSLLQAGAGSTRAGFFVCGTMVGTR